jgi:hypothetical protein
MFEWQLSCAGLSKEGKFAFVSLLMSSFCVLSWCQERTVDHLFDLC